MSAHFSSLLGNIKTAAANCNDIRKGAAELSPGSKRKATEILEKVAKYQKQIVQTLSQLEENGQWQLATGAGIDISDDGGGPSGKT